MRRILVLGLGDLSYGEITIAIESLRHLPEKGFELLFVSHPEGVSYIRNMGLPAVELNITDSRQNNRQKFEKYLVEWKPDGIICADVYTMNSAVVWSGLDFKYLKTLGLPIGSFDQYEWESTSFVWDLMAAPVMKMDSFLISGCDFLIRPCPPNKPILQDKKKIVCRLFGNNKRSPSLSRNECCARLNIPADKKIVFIINSKWEYMPATHSVLVAAMIKWMPRIIYEYLSTVGTSLVIVHVGPKPWDFPVAGHIKYRYLQKLDVTLYQNLLYYTDLFCSTNAISTTLSKAIFARIPSVLFQHNRKVNLLSQKGNPLPMPAWYKQMAQEVKIAYPFRVFPWGWEQFLTPLFIENDYTKTFFSLPVLNCLECQTILHKIFFDESFVEESRLRQERYFKILDDLPAVEESLLSFGGK